MTSIENRRADWRAKVAAQKGSGLTIAAWCAEHGVSTHTFSCWRAKFADLPVGDSQWISLSTAPAAASTLYVRVGAATLEVTAGFDARLLSEVVGALSQC
jgi:hypothetical protein